MAEVASVESIGVAVIDGGGPATRPPPVEDDSYISLPLKYFLFVHNLLIWVISGVIVAIGVWAFNEKNRFRNLASGDEFDVYNIIFDFTIFMVIIGLVIFTVAFMGCIGALRENVLLLKIFSYTLGVLFLLQVIFAALAFIFSGQLESRITNVLKHEGIERYRDDPDLQNFFDWVQKTFKCCGVDVDSYKDWDQNMYFNCSASNPSPEQCSVPYSCCIAPDQFQDNLVNTLCGYRKQELSYPEARGVIHTTGCVQKVMGVAKSNLLIIGGVAIGLAVPQLIGIFLARILCNQVEDQRDRYI